MVLLFNPFTDEQLNFFGAVPKQVWHFSSLYKSSSGCKTISRQAARRHPKLLHPKQNI